MQIHVCNMFMIDSLLIMGYGCGDSVTYNVHTIHPFMYVYECISVKMYASFTCLYRTLRVTQNNIYSKMNFKLCNDSLK